MHEKSYEKSLRFLHPFRNPFFMNFELIFDQNKREIWISGLSFELIFDPNHRTVPISGLIFEPPKTADLKGIWTNFRGLQAKGSRGRQGEAGGARGEAG